MELVKTVDCQQKRLSSSLTEEAMLRRAVRTSRRTFGAEHANVALSYIELGDYLANQSHYKEAEASYHEAAGIYEALGVGHELLLSIALRSLSQVLSAQERHDEALSASRQAIRLIVDFQ